MEGVTYILKLFVSTIFAHESEIPHVEPIVEPGIIEVVTRPLNELFADYSIWSVYAAAASIGLLILIAIAVRYPSESLKRILFWSITGIILITTGGLIGMTLYLNQSSVSKGPVHWHTDFQVWACDNQLDLKDPEGLSNSLGTSTLHEHNEGRIHVEGVVVDYKDINLGSFFRVIGGSLTNKSITVPTNEGNKTFINGQKCNNSNEEATLQTFVYQVDEAGTSFTQKKIDNPQDFQFTQAAQVPPGDCIIFEFGEVKDETDKLCLSYEAAKEKGDLIEEVVYEGQNGL